VLVLGATATILMARAATSCSAVLLLLAIKPYGVKADFAMTNCDADCDVLVPNNAVREYFDHAIF